MNTEHAIFSNNANNTCNTVCFKYCNYLHVNAFNIGVALISFYCSSKEKITNTLQIILCNIALCNVVGIEPILVGQLDWFIKVNLKGDCRSL